VFGCLSVQVSEFVYGSTVNDNLCEGKVSCDQIKVHGPRQPSTIVSRRARRSSQDFRAMRNLKHQTSNLEHFPGNDARSAVQL